MPCQTEIIPSSRTYYYLQMLIHKISILNDGTNFLDNRFRSNVLIFFYKWDKGVALIHFSLIYFYYDVKSIHSIFSMNA